ncbi:MAG: hybrid sensor histidine kinase/response regulator, partial [Proteobacteria bacterium]|nr:hybrid sensor histidine kinase/response regulator [Pseudomonadota bacterium]
MLEKIKEFFKKSFEEGTQIGKPLALFGMIIGFSAHLGFYFLFKHVFGLYENFTIRVTAAILSLLLGLVYVKRNSYSPIFINLCWHFIVIYILPFVFTVNLLKTNFHEVWLYWQIFMIFVLIVYVPNWLMFLIDLFLGISAASLYYFITSGSFADLDYSTFSATLYLLVIIFSAVTGLFFEHAARISYLAIQRKIYERAMKSLAASIVHEIRNPLNTINLIGIQIGRLLSKTSDQDDLFSSSSSSSKSDFSIQAETKSELIDLTADISKTVFDANNIINIILGDLSEKRISKEDFISLEVDEVLPDIVSRYSFNSEEEKSRVRLDVSDNDSRNFIFKAVLERFQFIIFNLLKNALYYARQYPDLVITIGTDPQPRRYKGKLYNVIYVKDINGPGIKPELISKLFDDFYTVGKKEGTGLGLSFCKRNMNLFQGDIICESGIVTNQNNGNEEVITQTKFSLLFPLVKEEEEDQLELKKAVTNKTKKSQSKKPLGKQSTKHLKNSKPRQQEEEESLIQTAIANKREKEKLQKQKDDLRNISQYQNQNQSSVLLDKNILIADDNQLTLKNLKDYLIDLGAKEVITANNGQELLNRFIESNQNSLNYDIIITDISMPIMNGDEAAKLIREYEKQHNLKSIPIIAATGNEENLLSFYKSGINDCFIKGEDYKKMVRV